MPTVSIVVPVYNAEKYLGWCINSILKQSFRDLELILVDDGSTDGSLEICRRYAALDSRVRVLALENGGVSAARNAGMQAAQGEFVQFVDSDDVVSPDYTGKLLETLRFCDADIAICGIQVVEQQEENGPYQSTHQFSCRPLGHFCVMVRPLFIQNMARLFWETCCMEGPCNRIYRTSIIRENGLEFPLDMSYGEDCMFNIEYYSRCRRAALISQPLYYYLWHFQHASLARSHKPNLVENQMRQVMALRRLCESEGEMTKSAKQALANYCVGQCIKSLNMLPHPQDVQELDACRREVMRMLSYPEAVKSFDEANYIPPEYAPLVGAVEGCDVDGILNAIATAEKRRHQISTPPPRPGFVNRVLVKLFGGLERLFKKGPVHKWARIMRLNLETMGLKITFQRMLGKVAGRSKQG